MEEQSRVIDVAQWSEQVDLYSDVPLHAQLRSIIEGHLQRDAYRVGDLLPGEEYLREHFSVSRPTVRHALADLEADAWIQRRRGIGTTIIREPVAAWSLVVDPQRSFTAPAWVGPGEVMTVEVTRQVLQDAPPAVASTLGVGPAVRVDRVLTLSGLAVGSSSSWLDHGRFERLFTESLVDDSVDLTLFHHYGVRVNRRDVRIRSLRAEVNEARLFKLPLRSPVLEVWAVGRDLEGQVLSCSTSTYNGALVSVEFTAPGPEPESSADSTAEGADPELTVG